MADLSFCPLYTSSPLQMKLIDIKLSTIMNLPKEMSLKRRKVSLKNLSKMQDLYVKKNNFYAVENTVDGKFFVTARGWEDLSRLLQSYEKLGIGISEELVEEFLDVYKRQEYPNPGWGYGRLDLYRTFEIIN